MIRRPTIKPSQSGDQDAASRLVLQEAIQTARTSIVRPTTPGVLVRIRVSGSSNNKLLGYSSLRGAKWNATPFDTVSNYLATAYNPASEVAITDDGIAYAVNLDAGSSACLVINRAITTVAGGILSFDMPASCTILAYRQVSVPVVGGGTVLAWEGYWA